MKLWEAEGELWEALHKLRMLGYRVDASIPHTAAGKSGSAFLENAKEITFKIQKEV